MSQPVVDTVVESVCEDFRNRSAKGIIKYGTTLDREDLTSEQWLQHLLEELMDAVLYAKKQLLRWKDFHND